jgi:hypothetical protein
MILILKTLKKIKMSEQKYIYIIFLLINLKPIISFFSHLLHLTL